VKNRFPSMGVVPKCGIFHGLSYEMCFEKIDGGLFALRSYTINMHNAVKKAQKGGFQKSSNQKFL
jgi:hypothetical protein